VQQVDHRSERRVLRADRSAPLPQFDLQSWESLDPDRTLEKLPRLSIESSPTLPDLLPRTLQSIFSARDSEPDMAATIELVPEVSLGDILEESAPVRTVLARPPLVLPPPVSAPFDLDRLLALARAETSRSPECFQTLTAAAVPITLDGFDAVHAAEPAATPLASFGAIAQADPFAARVRLVDPRTDATTTLPAILDRRKRRTGLIAGTVVAVAAITVGIVVGQTSVSSARSPQSVTVTRASVASPVVATRNAPVVADTTASSDIDAVTAIPAIPAMSVQSLPVAEVGTISLAAVAASHRLFVDGKLADGASAVVSCGKHLVQVGSRGARHYVNVPCGQEIVLAK